MFIVQLYIFIIKIYIFLNHPKVATIYENINNPPLQIHTTHTFRNIMNY